LKVVNTTRSTSICNVNEQSSKSKNWNYGKNRPLKAKKIVEKK